jgi:hypothetical protein
MEKQILDRKEEYSVIFDVIPENFFVVLSSPKKRIYWECIYKIYTAMEFQLSFGIDREDIVEELAYYFDSDFSLEIEDDEFDLFLREEKKERESGKRRSGREKANFVLRQLQAYGWISIEMNKSRQQKVVIEDYALDIIKTLVRISEENGIEYQGYIYTIYALTKQESEHPGITFLGILENTDRLISGLKSLNANIKKYMDKLTEAKTVAEIMDTLFEDYMINIIDKAYHRLVTSDNVSKFRPEIEEWLHQKAESPEYILKAADDLAEVREMSREAAREYILDGLRTVIDAFHHLDELIEEISRKSTGYQKAAVERARFLLASKEDVRGQLKELLVGLSEIAEEKSLDFNSIYEFEFLDRMIRLSSVAVLDGDSFYQPNEGKMEFVPEQAVVSELDEETKREKKRRLEEKLDRVLSVEKIEAYVLDRMGERERMKASELPLVSGEDFVKVIYVLLYGRRKKRKYGVEMLEEVNIGKYTFRDFWIVKG